MQKISLRMSKYLLFVMVCACLLPVTSTHRRRQKLNQLLGFALQVTTTPPPLPAHKSHFSFVVAPTPIPQNLLIALDSISTAATLGKEYDGNHDQYTTSTSTATPGPTPSPGYTGGLGPFSSDTFNKYYANNGLYSNDLGNGAGYWGGGGGPNYNSGGGGGPNYNSGGGNRNYAPMIEPKYSYDTAYDRDYSMSYDSGGYDYGGGSMVGSIGSYLSYLIMDPGSILMAAAAMSLKALVLNLVLVATNRTGRRRRSVDSPFDFDGDDDPSVEVLHSIMDTLQVTLEAPAKCRGRMFCEAGQRIRNGAVSKRGNVASIARYFGTKMEDHAYLSLTSSPPPTSSKYWPEFRKRQCQTDFPKKCPAQIQKLNEKFALLTRYLPYIDLISVEEEKHQPVISKTAQQEPT